jgi:hypothetical protein
MKISEILQLFAWEILNPAILEAKKNRVYQINGHITGINLGCGLDNPEK